MATRTQAQLDREFTDTVTARLGRAITLADSAEKKRRLQILSKKIVALRPVFITAKLANNQALWDRYVAAYGAFYAAFQREAGRAPRRNTDFMELVERFTLWLKELLGITKAAARSAGLLVTSLGQGVVGTLDLAAFIARWMPWIALGAGLYFVSPYLLALRKGSRGR